MATKEWKVEWTPVGTTSSIDLTNVLDVRVTRVLKAKNNGLELTLDNYAGNVVEAGEFIIKPDDTIKVYASNGLIEKTADNLLGVFTVLNSEIMPDGRLLKIVCGDKTYLMLSKVYAIRDKDATIDEHVAAIVQTVNETGLTQDPITLDIDSVRSDSSAMPSTRYTSAYKTAYDAIEELSQTQFTGDNFPYIFYFDEDNVYHWNFPGQTPEVDKFVYGADPITAMKISKSEAESISMIIYNAGEDLNGSDRINFELDPSAGTIKNRIRYNPWTDINQLVRQGLKDQYGMSDTENDTILLFISNDVFISLLDQIAIARCRAVFSKVGQGLWQSTVTVTGDKYTVGKFYTTSASELGFPPTNLRLERVVHSLNKNGWSTTLTLKEDPESENNI
jgi:hypothetical protein